MNQEYHQVGAPSHPRPLDTADTHKCVLWQQAGLPNEWVIVLKASWKQPEGEASSTLGRDDHPVVHISMHDAKVYCKWAGKSVPTNEQWLLAGGIAEGVYPWGPELGVGHANIWEGGEHEDGYMGTAPAQSFEAASGLYGMVGNVWEWTVSPYVDASKKFQQFALRGGSYAVRCVACRVPVLALVVTPMRSFDAGVFLQSGGQAFVG